MFLSWVCQWTTQVWEHTLGHVVYLFLCWFLGQNRHYSKIQKAHMWAGLSTPCFLQHDWWGLLLIFSLPFVSLDEFSIVNVVKLHNYNEDRYQPSLWECNFSGKWIDTDWKEDASLPVLDGNQYIWQHPANLDIKVLKATCLPLSISIKPIVRLRHWSGRYDVQGKRKTTTTHTFSHKPKLSWGVCSER